MTYTCPRCGKVYLTEQEKDRCPCRGAGKTCIECNGTGRKIQIIGPSIKCPRCNGSGKNY